MTGGTTSVAALQSLVHGEVRRHPPHEPVEAECKTTLHVEVTTLEQRTWLIGWLDGQPAARVQAGTSLENALAELVTQVLRSDPVALSEDMGRLLDVIGGGQAASVRGVMLYGFEAFQTVTWTDEGAAWLPGVAFRLRRGLGPFHVGARVATAFGSPNVAARHRVTVAAIMEPEFAWFVSPRATSSFYLGASLGVSVLRVDSRPGADVEEHVIVWGAHLGVRLGVELLRASDWRLDVFAWATLPWFRTHAPDSSLVDAWTPSVSLGLGAAF